MKKLSIVIPAYNEEAFIGELLEKVKTIPTEALGFSKQIIVVDDGSSDMTAKIAESFSDVEVIRQNNRGKGAAVQAGVKLADGDYLLVQDADLEYSPSDYLPMLQKLIENPWSAIYGSRPRGVVSQYGMKWPFIGRHPRQEIGPWVASVLLSTITLILFQKWITDPLTAYKIYPNDVLKSFIVCTCGFETDHELTAKLIKAKIPILEVPISYEPRSKEEGKKIRAIDGLIAVWTLLKFRFVD